MILGITNINKFLSTHGAFNLSVLHNVAEKYGMQFYVCRLDNVDVIESPYLHYSADISADNDTMLKEISKLKPQKVICMLENYFPYEVVKKLDAYKIYFVRSCDAQLATVIEPNDILNGLIKIEKEYMNMCDAFITDSPESARVVKKLYNKDCDVLWEYINPTKYNTLIGSADIDNLTIYNIGRNDRQKKVHLLNSYPHGVINIGKKEVDPGKKIKSFNFMPFEEYAPIIKKCKAGAFPAIWESNGYGVQECLAMGKVPLVQYNSGGNTRLTNSNNSILVDFSKKNWHDAPKLISTSMMQAAADTITYKMYSDSLDKFGEFINKEI